MMIRVLLLLLVSANLALNASEPINVSYSGASAKVQQPHVTAELIPETTLIWAGKTFDIVLHLHSDPGWHTYWVNPGDAGLATNIKWTLPPGFTAGPIQWPTPEKHNMGPLVTYGYEGDVYLTTTITPPASVTRDGAKIEITAKASWLVCQEECIPGKAELTVNATVVSGMAPFSIPASDNREFLKAVIARLPVPNTRWNVQAKYENKGQTIRQILQSFQHLNIDDNSSALNDILAGDVVSIALADKTAGGSVLKSRTFFPEQSNVLSAVADQGGYSSLEKAGTFTLITVPLQQNGEKPDKMSGVLVSQDPLIGDAKAVYISEFPVTGAAPSASGGTDNSLSGSQQATGGGQSTYTSSTAPPLGTAAATSEAQPWLIGVLGFAFIGGLILNLMPCVLPVLSLKVFSLIKHAEHAHSQAWKQGVAFTIGVVISFWVLVGILLALRAAGNHLGWGFQMQSPGFVLALIFIFFLLGLNLFGVFELGTSLVGLDAKVTGRNSHGLFTSFLNGALATLAATPCTAPFMGSALGFAAQQSTFISLLIFTFLALGMATPYLLLTIFPAALKFVPKPGAWMEAFKQFMGFLLMATVIFLLYVFGALVGEEQVYVLLLGLLAASVGGWLYGGWQRSTSARATVCLLAILLTLSGLGVGVYAATNPTELHGKGPSDGDVWKPWSQDAVKKALAEGKPVFVDFTAAWCLSCKVNERVALGTDVVQKAFGEKGVVLLKADWTHSDPEISKALQQYNRDGVPLYLLYSPKQPDQPQILPEVLTQGIVLEALGKI